MASRRRCPLLLLSGVLACSRVRDVPLTELPKLTAERRAHSDTIVMSTRGDRVRIKSFSRVAIVREICPTSDYCYETTVYSARNPERIHLYLDRVELVEGFRGRRPQLEPHVIDLDGSKTWARVSEASWSRGVIVSGVATAVGLAAAFGVGALVAAHESDQHGVTPVVAGVFAGAAAGGATLLITLPATRDLGTEVR